MAKGIVWGVVVLCALVGKAEATGWCEFQPGWQVMTHGFKSDKVWLHGKLPEQASSIWVQIYDPVTNTGQSSVSLALAAQFAGKRLQFYIDDETICSTFPNWGTNVRHLRVVD